MRIASGWDTFVVVNVPDATEAAGDAGRRACCCMCRGKALRFDARGPGTCIDAGRAGLDAMAGRTGVCAGCDATNEAAIPCEEVRRGGLWEKLRKGAISRQTLWRTAVQCNGRCSLLAFETLGPCGTRHAQSRVPL